MKVHINTEPAYSSDERRKRLILRFILGVVVSFLIGAFFMLIQVERLFPETIKDWIYGWTVEKGNDGLSQGTSLKDRLLDIPALYLNTLKPKSNDDLPQLFLDISFKRFQKLQTKRQKALATGILVQEEGDFVSAKIRYGESTTKVKLRLKGDWTDHLESDKWSLRIHTKGKNHLFSMRRFSIQHPGTRGYQGEIIFHETLLPFNVITPRYFFVNVVINGEDIGVMAFEEHLSKELLEHNKRKEGVIVRFSESLVWDSSDGLNRGFGGVFDNYLNAEIDAFRSSKIRKSKQLSKEYQIAVGLLRGFTSGKLTSSEVFDVEQMGSYIAVSQFWGAWHALRWHNLRFYLNPLTMKLEPIAFDANLQDRRQAGIDITSEPIIKHMLQDEELQAAYKKTLGILDIEATNGSLTKRLQKKEKPMLDNLHSEFFLLEKFDYGELTERAKSISLAHRLPINTEIYPVFVHAFRVTESNKDYLELTNALPFPVEILKIFWRDKSGSTLPFSSNEAVTYPLVLAPTLKGGLPKSTNIDYQPLNKESEYYLQIDVKIAEQDETRRVSPSPYYSSLLASPLPRPNPKKMFEYNSFIELQPDSTIFRVKPGNWQVHGNIVIPADHELQVSAGTTLKFEQDAGIVSYGTTYFHGTQKAPIVLDGIPAPNGTPGDWMGVVVHKALARSRWDFVEVKNTTGISWPLWKLTGGVTFLQSDIDLKNCIFRDNKAEDALNIVHSSFSLNNTNFFETTSDGFDGDYVTGSIQGGTFQKIGLAGGGDGIDFSGSKVIVEGTSFVHVNDKAVSAGEGSTLTLKDITIEDCGVGVASKDRSVVKLNNSTIRNARVAGLMCYVKKPEYGSATLVADEVSIIDSKQTAVVQTGSQLTFNGERIQPKKLDINKLYQTVMKPGSR